MLQGRESTEPLRARGERSRGQHGDPGATGGRGAAAATHGSDAAEARADARWSKRQRWATRWSASRAGVGARSKRWRTGWRVLPQAAWARWRMRPVRADPCTRMRGIWRRWTPRWTPRWSPRRRSWASPLTCGRRSGCRSIWSSRQGRTSAPAGCGRSWPSTAGCVGGPSRPSNTCTTPPPSPPRRRTWRRWGKKVRAEPAR